MQTTQLTIRIDEDLKKDVQVAARNFGLPLSALIKTFLSEVAMNKKNSLQEIYEETYFDYIVMQALKDKKITATLEKLADVVKKKCK